MDKEGVMLETQTDNAFGKALSKRPGFRSFSEAKGQVSAEELNAGVNNAATYLLPFYESGVNISNVAQEYMKPEQERDYDYIKSQFTEAGQSAAIEGGLLLMGGVAGKYGAKGIKALADKVKQYEINPNVMSAFGAGAIKKKTVEPLEIGINKALQDGKFLKRYDASIAADMTEKVKNATAGNTRANALINTAVPEGTKVGIRLNLNSKIPDMPKGLDKLQTLHKGSFSGKALSYLPFATVKNVVFSVNQTGRTGIASKIKGIDTPEAKSKFNAMSVDGEYVPNKNLLDNNKDLVEIGFNPGVHHLFIDLKTGQAVRGAKEATIIGDRVFAKGVEYWKKAEAPKPVPTQTGVNIPSDVRYKFKRGGAVMDDQMQMAFMAKGGIAMNKQTEMAFMQQGGLKDDGMKQDPISGNPIPNGSMAEEVRDDIPAQLSEGEYVVPADVVRYYGVKHFEDIRNNAKQGLQSMEANGRIGGEPVPVGGPKAGPMMQNQQMTSDLSQDEMQEIQSMMMAVGGFVEQPTNMQQQSDPYQQQNTMYKQPMAMSRGGLGFIPTTPPNLSPTVVSGSFSKSPAQQAAEAAANATAKATEVAKNKVTLYGLKGEEVSVVFPSEEYNQYIAQGYTTARPVTPKDDGPDNPSGTTGGGSTGSGSAGFEDWGKDWSDWSDPNAYADKISAGVIGTKGLKTGAGIATALGGPGLAVAIGVGGKIALGQAISDLRAASIIAKAQGLDTEYIDNKAAKLVEQGGGIFELADFLGLASGKIKAENNLTRLGLQFKKDDNGDFTFSTSQVKYNKDTTTKGSSDGSSGGGFSDTAVQIVDGQEVKPPKPVMRPRSRPTTSSSPKVTQTTPVDVAKEQESSVNVGGPGFRNKGGLMRKKKTKGK